jgi:RHS repeat-associated protein
VGDHLGTTSLVLDDQGSKVAESRHYPYGEERWSSGTLPTDYRFTGQRSDSGLGLYHMGARFYDPALGRWISADTLVPEPAYPHSLNRYLWVRNNPLKYIDPSGHMEDGECGPDGAGCATTPEGAPLSPEIEELIQVFSYFYGVPWQVVAGLLLSEIELDTQPKDYFETAFMHFVPPLAEEGVPLAGFLLELALLVKPDPGPGIGNVHVSTAKHLSRQFATRYAGNPLM